MTHNQAGLDAVEEAVRHIATSVGVKVGAVGKPHMEEGTAAVAGV